MGTQDPLAQMLGELRTEYTDRDAREARARVEAEAQARAREAHERARAEAERRRRMETRARELLAGMDPRSREGRWFADFARGYATPLEAAVAFLEARDEADAVVTGRWGPPK